MQNFHALSVPVWVQVSVVLVVAPSLDKLGGLCQEWHPVEKICTKLDVQPMDDPVW